MNRIALTAGLVVGAALVAAAGFHAGRAAQAPQPGAAAAPAADGMGSAGKVLYWHDPMVPGPRFDKPGKSPFMDMQLVPVYADDAGASGIRISPTVEQSLGIRTASVRREEMAPAFDAVGTVAYDERRSVAVQTRVAGYVEHLAVRAPMERVRKGQTLATIFAPDWLAPQSEWLALKRAGAAPHIVAAARERMRALSIPASLIRRSEAAGAAQARFDVRAPAAGVIAELGVRDGVAVAPGMTLFRIAGLEKVWAVAEVPEAQATGLARGQKVQAVLQADAARSFGGELDEILPKVSSSTRTLQARFEVDNPDGALFPGMLLRLTVAGPKVPRLLVPAEAVIRTGRRAVVIVRREDGTFEPRDVQAGADLGDDVEILQGLAQGEQVVASGQFLVDSEARLKSVLGAMTAPTEAAP